MIHFPLNTSLPELKRVLELIQRDAARSSAAVSTTPQVASSAGSGSTAVTGAMVPAGPPGTDGSAANLLVGADQAIEILMAPNGDVLTDENGYALLGIKVSSTIITGADTSSFGVLNAT